MQKLIRYTSILPLALGLVFAQEAGSLFEKAPPDIDEALHARITKFYQAFVDGKFRQADAYVAEESKDVFFAAEKRRYKACSINNVTYSDNYTKAKAVVSCDTDYFAMGRQFPIKLPVTSVWKIENGEWVWYVIPITDQTEYNSPFGPVARPPLPGEKGSESAPAQPKSVIQQLASPTQVMSAVKADRDSLQFNSAKSSKEELTVKNTMPGNVTLTASTGILGLKVTPAKVEIHANEEIKVAVTFDPKDPALTCSACLAHPQNRPAGEVTFRVEPTGQVIPIQVHFVVPQQAVK
jgi:hypothetical protein